MKALVYTAPNQLELQDLPLPVPLLGEELIRVEAVGICGSDMHAYHGHDSRRPPPLVLGHEAAGRIVGGARDGERVTINPLVVDPTCPYAIEGRWHLSPTRQIISMPPREGAFAQFIRIPTRNIVPIADDFNIEHAALAEPVAVAWHAVKLGMDKLHLPLASCRVTVLGGGAIGLACALVLKHFGAKDIHLGEPNSFRRETALAALTLNAYTPNSKEQPSENSMDLVIDAVGAVATRVTASQLVRPGGVIVHVGLLPGLEGLDIRKVTLQEITVTGAYCYTPIDFLQTVEALYKGHLGNLNWYETRPLIEGAEAFKAMDSGQLRAAKIILKP